MSRPGVRRFWSWLSTWLVLAVLASALLPGSEPLRQEPAGAPPPLRRELRKF